MLTTVIIIRALPVWPHAAAFGYGPSGLLGLVLVVLLVLLVLGYL